jgi:hypothetical protein
VGGGAGAVGEKEAMKPHVTAETRTVYRSARGTKLTRHAAYVAAAKALIADRCKARNDAIEAAHTATDAQGETVVSWETVNAKSCDKSGPEESRCRFHTWPESEDGYSDPPVSYYRRVLDRLVPFLKYVDNVPAVKPCPYCKRGFRATPRARCRNPFCAKCLHDRLREASAGLPLPRLVHEGRYMRVTREAEG